MIKLNRPPCPHSAPLENKTDYKHKENKKALKDASNDKCMYCESKISHIDFAHVEHIKPKAADKFPELKFEWDNLGYACPICNNTKSDKYWDDCTFIDPYSDNPKEHLVAIGTLLQPKRGCERGEITIVEIGLNRPELLEKRGERIKDVENAIKTCFRTKNTRLKENAINELKKEANVDKEYSMVVEALLNAHGLLAVND